MLMGMTVRPGGIQHQEHDLGVGRRVLVRVQVLEFLHGLQAQGGRRVVQPQHVRCEVHDDGTMNRVVLGHLREKLVEERPHQTGKHVHGPAPLPHLHEPEPKGEHTNEADADLHCHPGHLEGAVHHGREDLRVLEEHQANESHEQGDQEEGDPEVIQNHGASPRSS